MVIIYSDVVLDWRKLLVIDRLIPWYSVMIQDVDIIPMLGLVVIWQLSRLIIK